MGRWYVDIDGDQFDCKDYLESFPDGPVFAVQKDGHVCLTGPEFEQFPTATDVRAAASNALQELSSVISVLSPKAGRVSVGTVHREEDDGPRHAYVFAGAASISIRALAPTLFISGGPQPPKATSTRAQQLLSLVKQNMHLSNALDAWRETPRSWPRLYRIMEEIEAHLGMDPNLKGMK